jgi:NADH:ubiquinone oxidoreductase subunit 3 (subunit A)
MGDLLLTPVVLFFVLFAFAALLSFLLTFLSYRKGKKSSGVPYACGEEHYDVYAQPDYSQFFPFAFFFTIAHVATMMFAAIPFVTNTILAVALMYIATVVIGLFILLWRD